MWPYCGQNLGIWKCPADRSYVVVDGQAKPRVRSMSMNFYLGGFGGWDGHQFLDTAGYKLYFKQTELADPGPAKVFVFLDMRPDSIDIGNFATRMSRLAESAGSLWLLRFARLLPPPGGRLLLRRRAFRTAPLARRPHHAAAGGGRRRRRQYPSPDNPDVGWLQDHATRPKTELKHCPAFSASLT